VNQPRLPLSQPGAKRRHRRPPPPTPRRRPTSSDVQTAIDDSGFDDSGFDDSGFDDSGFDDSGFDDSGFDDSGADESAPQVEVRRSSRRTRTVTAYRDRDTIVVLIPQRMSKADEQTFVRDMVERVLAREARALAPRGDEALVARARELAATYLAPALDHLPEPAGVSWVTNQHQRWGSCTPSTGLIRLSHRLQPMPAWVVDYVLLHELAHLVEPSHSDRFWRLVGRYPATEKAKGYLEGYLAGQGRQADEFDVD
jgi:predicted metal-dependent hydrolase